LVLPAIKLLNPPLQSPLQTDHSLKKSRPNCPTIPKARLKTPAPYRTPKFLRGDITMGEIFTVAGLAFSLILVGLALGFGLLKIQGGEE
jgi:cytochrome b6-f complex subunit 7